MSTDDPDGSEGSLSSGLFAATGYSAAEPPKRSFQPWHRPRKQFVRREQWLEQIRLVLEDRPIMEPLRYLGLPGTDLLDLRYFHSRICEPAERSMRFLGFNSEARNAQVDVELRLSLSEVLSLDFVDQEMSDVMRDDFRVLAQPESLAMKRVKRIGPFDVVNLDLCNGFGKDDPDIERSLYDAVAQLFALQVRNPDPWVFLLTTRIDPANFHDEVLSRFAERIHTTSIECPSFAEVCAELLDGHDPAAVDPQTLGNEGFQRFGILALAVWVLALCQAQADNHVSLSAVHGYTVHGAAECPDLVSLALVVRPVLDPPADPIGVGDVDRGIDQCEEATAIAWQVIDLEDVDALLAGDMALFDELADATADLLEAARYDRSKYFEWLQSRSYTS